MKTLLLGLGNELYGDDGVGIHVVRRIREEMEKRTGGSEGPDGVECVECSLSGLALLDIIVGHESLVIVDTIKKEGPVPGKIHILEEKDLRAIPGPSPHYISFPQTLEIGREWGLPVPRHVKIVGIEAKNMYHLGEGLSEEMSRSLPAIIQTVKVILKTEIQNEGKRTDGRRRYSRHE